ncbi:hypothetical protein OVN20_00180 [Microcella daejeonensis]|uniref:hypothetical protein n=1 Tax=Microcella daejeonensis TaxID=2994971 RepID=UPI00226F3C14|nr:hypothetical protein [Microcella daejeonensis]WAB84038.1 hypothetical protein OVN20_00180 [Microcella daejeonensis]
MLAGVLALALAVRIAYVLGPLHRFDSDNSVVYLMALNVADGEFPAFFWGQTYGGSILPLTAGAVMAVVGPSVELMAIIGALFFLASAVMVYLVGASVAGPWSGVVAAVAFLFAGESVVRTSVIEPGFYGPSLLIGLASIALVQRRMSAFRSRDWALLGALAGLALWTSPMAAALVAPAALAMIVRRWSWRGVGIATAFGLVAASPWIIASAASLSSTVRPLGGQVRFSNLIDAVTVMLPSAFPLGTTSGVRAVVAVAVVASVVVLVVVGVRRRMPGPLVLAASTLLVHVVLALGSGVPLGVDSARYAVFYIPALAVVAGLLARRSIVVAIVISAVAIGLTSWHVAWTWSTAGEATRFDPNFVEIAEVLEDEGIDAAYGSYWMAYSLTASVDEEVTVASLVPRRYDPYEEEAQEEPRTAVVVYAEFGNDELLSSTPRLPPFERTQIGGYAVYVFDGKLDPYSLQLELF